MERKKVIKNKIYNRKQCEIVCASLKDRKVNQCINSFEDGKMYKKYSFKEIKHADQRPSKVVQLFRIV